MRKAPYRAYRLVLFTLSAGGSALLVLVLVERYGKTLRDAVSQGDVKALRRLLKRGADVHAKDRWGQTALHRAADWGRADVVKVLLEHGADVNARDADGATPLDEAWFHYTDVVKLLLEKGADPNATTSRYPETRLHEAVRDCRTEVAKLLLDKGADVSAKGDWGRTALHWAADRGRADLVKLLLKKGADANAKDKDGKTPLDLARKEEMRALLLKHIQAQD